ncbi:tyrosine recombinase XerC [Kitasatospora sp. NPDC006697]|uniref:site-specific integrase n=1 Tax=Kitasatospora sp. NPDC006697 TaxID=3364020 RepID=UPI003682055B
MRARDVNAANWILTCRRQTTPAPGGLVDKHTKGGTARFIPIIEPLRPLITRRLQAARGDPDARLYTGPRGGRISTAVLRDATHWNDVTRTLGYEHLRRHDLRHTGLTWMADAGFAPHVLQEIAGHKEFATTQRYLHPDLRAIIGAGETLTRYLLEQLRGTGQIPRRWQQRATRLRWENRTTVAFWDQKPSDDPPALSFLGQVAHLTPVKPGQVRYGPPKSAIPSIPPPPAFKSKDSGEITARIGGCTSSSVGRMSRYAMSENCQRRPAPMRANRL